MRKCPGYSPVNRVPRLAEMILILVSTWNYNTTLNYNTNYNTLDAFHEKFCPGLQRLICHVVLFRV